MNRRSFIKALSGAALVAITPLKYVHEPTYQKTRVSIEDLVTRTLRARSAELVANIQRNNDLLKRLNKRGTISVHEDRA